MKPDVMEITNDRFTSRTFSVQHLCPYEYIKGFVNDKIVLDAGTATGYGAYYLSEEAREVKGIDIDNGIIAKAKKEYFRDNLDFKVNSVLDIEFEDEYFDIIVSSQVIEHIPLDNLDKYLSEIYRVLKKDGIFFVSTLNLINNLKGRNPENYDKSPMHIKEFKPGELKEFLLKKFSDVEILGLHRGRRHKFYNLLKKSGIFKMKPDVLNPVKKFYNQTIDLKDFVYSTSNLDKTFDLLGICQLTH